MVEEKLSDKYKKTSEPELQTGKSKSGSPLTFNGSEFSGGTSQSDTSVISYIQRLKHESRENTMILLLGETGVGKSYGVIQLAKGYARDNPITGKRARMAFIFDCNGEPEYAKEFPNAITPKQILSVTRPDVYRILPIKEDGNLMDDEEIREAMIFIAKNGKRCAMFFDDIDSYFEGAKPRDLSRLFMGFRHRGGRDVVFIHQRWSVILPKERAGAKYISLRHTSESVELTKGRWKNAEILMIAENMVEEQYELSEKMYLMNKIGKDEYKKRRSFFVDIDVRLNKIVGVYSKKCFVRNCIKYLNANPSIISQFQKINCDKNGNVIYDREQAIQKVIETRLWKYFAGRE